LTPIPVAAHRSAASVHSRVAADRRQRAGASWALPAGFIAGVLSFVAPGAGHLYAGVPGRGALAWLASRMLGFVALTAVVRWRGPWGLAVYAIAVVVIAGAVAMDAVATMRRQQSLAPTRWFARPLVTIIACGVVVIASLAWTVLVDGIVADRVRVPTDTMAPTILAGDRMFAGRLSGGVRRGDIIVYKLWETRYVKRVLGLPGDTVAMRSGTLTIDGRPVTESYAIHVGEDESADPRFRWQRNYRASNRAGEAPTLATWGPLIVPSGDYFVLGDNRGQSVDSRYDGFLPDSAILGRPLTIYFSRDPSGGPIRWERVGMAVSSQQPAISGR
jgi:signal peptidase I